MNEYRHKISELIARYRLEPGIRDVFVEGFDDVRFFRRVFSYNGVTAAKLYPISTVEIGPGELAALGYADSEHDRVVYMAIRLGEGLAASNHAVTCIADRDFEVVVGAPASSPFLFLIDWCGLECYGFDIKVVEELIHRIAPESSLSAATVIHDIRELLKDLFSIRATNELLGLHLTWLPTFDSCCDLSTSPITFDADDFIGRYLNKSNEIARKPTFLATYNQVRSALPEEARLCIRGHDISAVLSWYLRKKLKRSDLILRDEVFHDVFVLSIDVTTACKEAAIREIVTRLKS